MKRFFLLTAAAAIGLQLYAAPAETGERQFTIDELNVIGHKAEIESNALRLVSTISAQQLKDLPVTCLNDILEYLPGIDVRARGAGGTQADLSMRGGTFDQVLVMLNGVNLTDPQTGHYTLDLPVDVSQIERIEVLQGTGMSLFGLSAFSGAINIVTKTQDVRPDAHVDIRLQGGENGYFSPMIGGRISRDNWQGSAYVRHDQSQGYMHNTDYQLSEVYAQGSYHTERMGELQAQVGGQIKNYGANSFYSLKYPDQFDATKTLFVSTRYDKRWKQLSLSATAYWRTHYDRFELIRDKKDAPAWYVSHNYHVTHVNGVNAQVAYVSRIGRTSVGVELRNEYIKSNVLGDSLSNPLHIPFKSDTTFTYGKNRLNFNYFAEQAFFFGRFAASVGVSGNWNTMFGHNFCAGANIGYNFAPQGRVYVNVNRSLRLPTFTDLYYKSATQIANPDLKPEQALTAELGVKWQNEHWQTQATVYYRHGTDIIDWVRQPSETKWRCVNHTSINAAGGEVSAAYRLNEWLR
ncbi:MAG: TonB-dependent receptor, partial [Paludibacteraceae bacterium]|nr:TonB-dependent receptor [Paludibacteraceae bacterium]